VKRVPIHETGSLSYRSAARGRLCDGHRACTNVKFDHVVSKIWCECTDRQTDTLITALCIPPTTN